MLKKHNIEKREKYEPKNNNYHSTNPTNNGL